MGKLSRLSSMMAVASMAAMASTGQAAVQGMQSVAAPSIKLPKTDEPSTSKGGRSYGRNKRGSTAAFVRAARKSVNVKRHRAACR